MALITTPSSLNDGATDNGSTEVFIDPAAKTIKLNITGALSTDGVTGQCVYSFLKEEWLQDNQSKNLMAYPFPMESFGPEQFEMIAGWDWADDTTRYLIRTAGWAVRPTLGGNATAEYAGIIGLGSVEANDQPYFFQEGGAVTPFQLQGQVNQAIKIYEDTNADGTPDFDYRDDFTVYVREQGQTYGQSTLADIGVTNGMTYIAYRFPLSTATDLKITLADSTIDTGDGVGWPADAAPYSGVTITYSATPVSKLGLAGGSFDYGITIDGNGQNLQTIYNVIQYALRQPDDIDENVNGLVGQTSDPLMHYVGDTMYTDQAWNPAYNTGSGGMSGVFIENFDSGDINSVYFTDDTGAARNFPYTANLTLNFSPTLVSDGSAEYWVFFSDATTSPVGAGWGTATAVIVDDADTIDMQGLCNAAQKAHTYDYDGDPQGAGVTPGITVVAIGLSGAQYVQATGTIARSTTNVVTLVAPLERNYAT